MQQKNVNSVDQLSIPDVEIIQEKDSQKIRGGFSVIKSRSSDLESYNNTNCKGSCPQNGSCAAVL